MLTKKKNSREHANYTKSRIKVIAYILLVQGNTIE